MTRYWLVGRYTGHCEVTVIRGFLILVNGEWLNEVRLGLGTNFHSMEIIPGSILYRTILYRTVPYYTVPYRAIP